MSAPDKEPRIWWTRLVREASSVTGPARAVLYFLADVADADGVSFYAQRKIALGAGVTDRTVRTVMKALEADGLIVVGHTPDGYRAPSVRLVESALVKRKDVPVGKTFRPEGRSGGVGKTFRGSRKDVPVEAEGRSYKEPMEEPIEDPSEVTKADGDSPPTEPAQPVTDDRPSHPALSPVDATADGRTGDGEGFPLAHAPTPPAALRGSDASDGGGEPAKGRKKRAPAGPSPADLDAWSDCAILWQQISGKTRLLNPDAGAGRSLAEAIAKIGARRMLARLEGAKVDDWVKGIMESPKPLSLVALCRHDLPWLDRVEASGEEILSAREASAPIDWRATLDRWVLSPDTHPGLAEPALWTTLRAAAFAQGARGDAPTVLRWLADPVNRSATLAALTEPEKPAAPAGPRVRTWDEVLEACRTQGSAGLTVAEYGVVTDVGRAADGRGDLVAYVGGASGDLATRMRRYAAHMARGRVTVLAVVA